jgi:hypothetical protein
MEAQLYRSLYELVWSLAHAQQKRTRFNDRIIVMVYLWSVLWDRSVSWACDPANWAGRNAFELPSDSTMSRRLRTVGVQQLIERALAAGSDLFGPPPLVKQVDSKPMYVGPYSKDRDAKRGRVAEGQFARGYRLHTLNHGRMVRWFTLAPMNEHDSRSRPRWCSAGSKGAAGTPRPTTPTTPTTCTARRRRSATSWSRRRGRATRACGT